MSYLKKELLFERVAIRNFRVFSKFEPVEFSRINIIGGLNGIGKSTFLEVLFYLVDAADPSSIFKPFGWREIGLSNDGQFDLFFKDKSKEAKIEFDGRSGSHQLRLLLKDLPPDVASKMVSGLQQHGKLPTTFETPRQGLRSEIELGSRKIFGSYLATSGNAVFGSIDDGSTYSAPYSIIKSARVGASRKELADRYTQIILSNREKSVIEPLQHIKPDLEGFRILHDVEGPYLVALTKYDGMVLLNLLGDGFRNLFDAILSINTVRNGAVFLDEVDNTLHYSVVEAAWKAIAQAASEQSVQVFATSHSREAIVRACQGVVDAGLEKDFRYLRLEAIDGVHSMESYTANELRSAEEYNFEFR